MSSYRFGPSAVGDIEAIRDYIAGQSIDNAIGVMLRLQAAFEFLGDNPTAGHFRDDLPDRTLRCWSVHSFLIIYAPAPPPIRILRVVSGYRDVSRLRV